MSAKKSLSILCLGILIALAITFSYFSRGYSGGNAYTYYPQPTIVVTLYQQGVNNWCGPGSLQSAIQWITQYNDGHPLSTVEPIIPKSTLWAYMRDNTCANIGNGRDQALPGIIGDGIHDVRKMNIAYDFGVDPHAMAWTMTKKAPSNHYYHY